MSLLRRMFSADYRQALAAEAQGDFLTAAKHFALCGQRHKVADMHLAQAHTEAKVEDRVRCLRSALSFLEKGDDRRPMVLRLLGRGLRDLAAAASEPQQKRELIEEAASILEAGESWEAAGDCFMELNDRNRAANAYARAGLLEKVEEVLSQQEREHDRMRREDSGFRDYELLLQGGQRDEAVEALRGCVEAAEQKGEYRRLMTELQEKLIRTGRVELEVQGRKVIVVGHYPLLIGRDRGCDLQARGSGVSRQHCQVTFDGEQLLVSDCASRNGTLLNGLRIGAALPLPVAGLLGLGEDCQVAFTLGQLGQPPVLRLEVVRGLDQNALVLASLNPLQLGEWLPDGPPLELTFVDGRPRAGAATRLTLNGALASGRVQLIRGDIVATEGRSLRVVG